MAPRASSGAGILDDTNPNFATPAAGPTSMMAAALPAGTFWMPANDVGAVEPGTATPWYDEGNWTRWTP